MKKVLFLDRDGTLITEPPEDFQVDSLEKLEFMPGVFRNLFKLKQFTDFELVIVSNQDGLGTDAFPKEAFRKPHEKFLEAFRNEGVEFDAIYLDPSLPEENSPNRKPGTGMLTRYLEGDYDLRGSYVIGDRLTDMELARNLGARAILLGESGQEAELESSGLDGTVARVCRDWDEIYRFIRSRQRCAAVKRITGETEISVRLSLDGEGLTEISTGLGFFDHMLDQLGRHGGMDLEVKVAGDLHVDEHHTIEDTALALGEAFKKAVGDKRGMERYGFCLPMDDCLAMVAVDFGGRPWLVWETEFKREKVGDMPTEMFMHFFKSFSDSALCNMNVKAEGQNEHHKIEAIFKAMAKAIKMAIRRDVCNFDLPSTKGKL